MINVVLVIVIAVSITVNSRVGGNRAGELLGALAGLTGGFTLYTAIWLTRKRTKAVADTIGRRDLGIAVNLDLAPIVLGDDRLHEACNRMPAKVRGNIADTQAAFGIASVEVRNCRSVRRVLLCPAAMLCKQRGLSCARVVVLADQEIAVRSYKMWPQLDCSLIRLGRLSQ